MAGLSTDPEKARRQRAGLAKSNSVVAERLATGYYDTPAEPPAQQGAHEPSPATTPAPVEPRPEASARGSAAAGAPSSAAPAPQPAHAPITHTAAGHPVVGYQEPPRGTTPEPRPVDPAPEPGPVAGPPEPSDSGRDAGEPSGGGGFWSGFLTGQ